MRLILRIILLCGFIYCDNFFPVSVLISSDAGLSLKKTSLGLERFGLKYSLDRRHGWFIHVASSAFYRCLYRFKDDFEIKFFVKKQKA